MRGGPAFDPGEAYLRYRQGEESLGADPVQAYLDYRRGEWDAQ